MLDLVLDAFLDTCKTLPFLFFAYLLLECLEHRAGSRFSAVLTGPWSVAGGAALGLVPQCGFSAMAANFYSGGVISAGTLLAVFAATSDEAIPILLSHPEALPSLLKLLPVKFFAAVLLGYGVNFALRRKQPTPADIHDLCGHCGCEDGHILRPAIRHTITIALFLFVTNLVLGFVIDRIGLETISRFLLTGSVLQPVLAALIGIVPNCAASVLLTQLHVAGTLSFGSLAAGLSMGAGAGMIVLWRTNKNWKQNLCLVAALFVFSVILGLVCDIIW